MVYLNLGKDRISNEKFWNLYQNNKFKIDENDFQTKTSRAVSGNTLQCEYPLHVENCQIKLNGGFYQGFSTECDKYKVLPTELKDNDT